MRNVRRSKGLEPLATRSEANASQATVVTIEENSLAAFSFLASLDSFCVNIVEKAATLDRFDKDSAIVSTLKLSLIDLVSTTRLRSNVQTDLNK